MYTRDNLLKLLTQKTTVTSNSCLERRMQEEMSSVCYDVVGGTQIMLLQKVQAHCSSRMTDSLRRRRGSFAERNHLSIEKPGRMMVLDDKFGCTIRPGEIYSKISLENRSPITLGLTNPKPESTFGFEDPANPHCTAPRLSSANTTSIKMADLSENSQSRTPWDR